MRNKTLEQEILWEHKGVWFNNTNCNLRKYQRSVNKNWILNFPFCWSLCVITVLHSANCFCFPPSACALFLPRCITILLLVEAAKEEIRSVFESSCKCNLILISANLPAYVEGISDTMDEYLNLCQNRRTFMSTFDLLQLCLTHWGGCWMGQ